MAKGYILVELSIPDAEAYRASGYMQQAEASIARHGGRYLIRGGEPAVLEGEGVPGRIVVLEFPSRAAAQAWHASEDYAPAKALRQSLSRGRAVLLDGLE
jgi:uncharacterized protein (DUF1330 family)